MEVIRVLNLRNFDRTSRRFRDVVFRNTSKPPEPVTTPDGRGGFSVFDAACACVNTGDSNCICRHISRFYGDVGPEPCAYWRFDTNIFNPPIPNPNRIQPPELIPSPSASGDECHRNLHQVSDNRLERTFREPGIEAMLGICAYGTSEPFTVDRAIELCNQYYPDPEDNY